MRTYGVERLGAFSDGVFAIVATLLVLDIKLPDPPLPGREIGHELVGNIPAFIGWLVSFVVLARFWTIHHHVVHVLDRVSRQTIAWNFVFLATISLLPFAASLVGIYEFDSAGPLVVSLWVLEPRHSPWAYSLYTSPVQGTYAGKGTTISTGCGGNTAWSLQPSGWWPQVRRSSIQP